jgi:cytoskeletal protein CcmA (bactofilin family)
MKKLGIAISLLLISIIAVPVFAQELPDNIRVRDEGRVITLSQNETIDSDFFAAGETVIISGTVTGDAYIAAGQVIIDGTIEGDLLVAGGNLQISGTVGQDVRAVGGQISVSGTVSRNLTLIGGNLDVTPAATLEGNIVLAGGNATLNTPLNGDLTAGVGNLTLGAPITGDVKVGTGQLTLTSAATIDGNLTYISEQEASLAPDATVSGTIDFIPSERISGLAGTRYENIGQAAQDSVRQLSNLFRLASLISALVVGFFFVHFFPNYSYQAITAIEEKPWLTLMVGLVGLIVTPVLAFIIALTVIGIPLSAILIALYAFALYFSKIIFAYWLGARLIHRLRRMAGPTVTLFVGLGLYYVLSSIAIIGPLVMLASLFWGLGALLLTDKDAYLTARITKIV